MNHVRLLLVAAVLCPSVGCEWMKQKGIFTPSGGDKDKEIAKVEAPQLVGYLNERADRLQSLTDADVTLTAVDRSGLVPTPPYTLRGDLFAVQPRNFKLTGTGGAIDVKVFLGSNEQQFWVYAKVPTVDPMFVYASHSDFEAGRVKIPGNIPFEPDWVMQALGMYHPPANVRYAVSTDPRARTYTLSWPAVTPNGAQVVKKVVFDIDPAAGTKPQVKKHLMRDAKTNKVLCSAEVKEAKTVPVAAAAPGSGLPGGGGAPALAVQYPTDVLLRWEEQKFELRLKVQSAKVNQQLTQEEFRRHFSRPNVPGTNPVDLARLELPLRP